MKIKLFQDIDGSLLLSINDVPDFELKPDETLIDCIRKQIYAFRTVGRKKSVKANLDTNKHANTLEEFLRLLKL